MIARRKLHLVAALAMSAAMFAPVSSSAASSVTCLNAWGKAGPGTWCSSSFTGELRPNDSPYGYGEKGRLYVRGVASPNRQVLITVTDGTRSVSRAVTSHPTGDTSAGIPAGGFSAELKVTSLGTHTARAGAQPSSLDPEDYGKSTLTVTADDGLGSGSTTVTKYAATYKDGFAPVLSRVTWPPSDWCHNNQVAFGGGCGFGFFGTGSNPSHTNNQCPHGVPGVITFGSTCSSGEAAVSGFANDDPVSSGGHASEIADIIITISQGPVIIKRFSAVAERGTGVTASWFHNVRINDFEPNWIEGDPYRITVDVSDAWGNTTSTNSGDIYVYPF